MKRILLALLLLIGVSGYSQSRWINMATAITLDSTVDVGGQLNTLIANNGVGSTFDFTPLGGAAVLINTSWVINKQVQIIGGSVNLKTTANITMVDLTAQLIVVQGLNFNGDGKSSGKTSQFGIRCLNGRNIITNCRFFNIAGEAMRLQFSAAPSHGVQVNSPFINECNIGINVLPNFAGEYVNVENATIWKCKTGVKLGAGNFLINNSHIDYNDTAFSMVASANDGHGVISNSTMNHCIRSFSSTGTLLGMDILGCRIYSGDIYIKYSKGIRFQNCGFRTVVVNVEDSYASFDGSLIDTHGGAAFTVNYVGTNYIRFNNNTELEGNIPTYMTKSTNTTLTELNNDILADGTISITLPPAYKKFDKNFTIRNIGSGIVTVVGTISGLVNPTLNSQYSYITVYSDGVNYYVKSIQNGTVSGVTPRRVLINN